MKRKILAITMLAITSIVALTGCGKNKDNGVKFVISNDYVDVAEYKGLETAEYTNEVSDIEVDSYIEYIMNFPENLPAGSTEQYTIKDLTNEIVEKISGGEYKSIPDYKAYIKTVVKEQNLSYFKDSTKEKLFNKVVENSVLKTYDEKRLDEYITYLNDYYKEYANYLSLDFKTFYAETMGLNSEEEYNNYVEEEAMNNIKKEYVIEAIANAEKIEITEEDINTQIQTYLSGGYFETEEEVLKSITKDEIKTNLQFKEILTVIYDSAVFVKASELEEETTQISTYSENSTTVPETIVETDTTEASTETTEVTTETVIEETTEVTTTAETTTETMTTETTIEKTTTEEASSVSSAESTENVELPSQEPTTETISE